MRLNLKPVRTIQALAATAASFTICMAPVAQGAQAATNQKLLINQLLKETGVSTKKQTVGQFWAQVRHVYPPKLQKQMDQWVKLNKNEMMPTVEATTFKDANGIEQVRLNMNMGQGKNITITYTGDEEFPLKVNGVALSKKEVFTHSKIDTLMMPKLVKDPTIKKSLDVPVEKGLMTQANFKPKKILNGRELAQLPLRAQTEYLMKLRLASEAADKVMDLTAKPKKGAANDMFGGDAVSTVWNMLLKPEVVQAAGMFQDCVASGWIATYYEGSCAKPNPGRKRLLDQAAQLPFNDGIKKKVADCATGGGLPCNPMIYGFSDNNGTPYCIKSDLKSATYQCSTEKAPLPSSKERIIQSIVAAKGGQPSLCKIEGEKTVSQACTDALGNYVSSLQNHYLNAANFCTNGEVKSVDSREKWVTKSGIRGDQKQACDNLRDRFFDLQVVLTGQPPIAVDDCATMAEGATKKDGKCVCPDGAAPRPATQGVGEDKAATAPAPKVTQVPFKIADKDDAPPAPGEGGAAAQSSSYKFSCVAAGMGGQVEKAEECSEWSWCKKKGLYIPLGVLGLGLLGAWLLYKHNKKDKKSSPTYEPPAGVPEPSPTVTTTPGTGVENPDPNPSCNGTLLNGVCCVLPNIVEGGVCKASVIVTPPPEPSSEGGTTTGTILINGVR